MGGAKSTKLPPMSRSNSMSIMELFKTDMSSHLQGQNTPMYSLEVIADRLKVEHQKIKDHRAKTPGEISKGTSDFIASMCVEALVKDICLDPIAYDGRTSSFTRIYNVFWTANRVWTGY